VLLDIGYFNISAATQDSQKKAMVWTDKTATLLVHIRIERDHLFLQRKGHKALWEDISREMLKNACQCTGEQCSNKWKSIKRLYMETVDHNSKTGNDHKTCKFYEELHALYGNKESTKPSFLIDSRKESNDIMANESDMSDGGLEEAEQVTPKAKAAPKKARKLGKKSPTVKWLDMYAEKQEHRYEDQKKDVNRRHEEKMQRFDRFLDILEK
jgi:hypothetical protein